MNIATLRKFVLNNNFNFWTTNNSFMIKFKFAKKLFYSFGLQEIKTL